MTRQCGDCTACCTVMGVKSLDKPAYTPCSKLCASGCSIYAERPDDCRDFSCFWLQDDGRVLRNMERPDRVGVMLDVTTQESGQKAFVMRAVRPRAFNEVAAKELIERLAKRVPVILVDGETRKLIGPPVEIKRFVSQRSAK